MSGEAERASERLRGIVVIGLAAALAAAASGAAAGPTAAIATGGAGDLTICRDWLVYDACDTYHHVTLPGHIAVDDRITLTFGSSDKQYDFRVVGIDRRGTTCTLRSPHTGPHDSGEKIVVDDCRPAAKPAVPR